MKLLRTASIMALLLAISSSSYAQEKSKETISSKPVELNVKEAKTVKVQKKKAELKQVKAKKVEAEPRTVSSGIKQKEAEKIEKVEK